MTTDSIFSSGDQPKEPTATSQDSGLFSALVGESQKYKTPEELAKAYTHADEFINKLKEENARLREQAAQAKTLDEVLERINQPAPPAPEDKPAPSPQVTQAMIADLVEQTLTGRETANTRKANLAQADKLMREQFGEKAVEVFKTKATTPQLQEAFMELASQSPADFMALFGGASAPATPAMDSGSVSTASLPNISNSSSKEWSKDWVAKVRKEDPTRYWSAEFQYQLQDRVTKNRSLYFN